MRGILYMLIMHIAAIGIPAHAQSVASANSGSAGRVQRRWNQPLRVVPAGVSLDRGTAMAKRACSTSTGIISPCTASASVPTGATGRTFQFDLDNNTDFSTFTGGVTCQVTAPVTSCSMSPSSYSLTPGADVLVTVTYAVSSTVGTGTVKVVTGGGLGVLTGTLTVTTTSSSGPVASITPHTGSVTLPSGSTSSQAFTLTNTGTAAGGFSFVVTCVAPATGCSTPSPIASLAIGAQSNLSVGYTAGTAGSGSLKLVAVPSTGTAKDSGTIAVTVPAALPCTTTSGVIAPCTNSVSYTGGVTGKTAFITYQNTSSTYETGSVTCSFSAPITACAVTPTSYSAISPGYTQVVQLTYSVANTTGTGIVTVSLPSAGVASVLAVHETAVVIPPTFAVTVGPDRDTLTVTPAAASSKQFIVTNNSSVATTFALTAKCSGAGVLTTPCQPSPASTPSLTPGQQYTVAVSFTGGTADANGQVSLTATQTTPAGPASDSGWTVVLARVLTAQAPTIDVASVNPGTTVDRNLCLKIAAGPMAASECGALRIVHPLRSVRTLNKVRTPTLIYSSGHAQPLPVVSAIIGFGSHTKVPDTVVVVLRGSGGQGLDSIRVLGSSWQVPSSTRRVALRYSALSSPTDFYKYTLEARNVYNGSSVQTASVTSQLIVVNRSTSEFGAGWWLAGLERLYLSHTDTILWVGGDGSARVYTRKSATVFTAPNVDHPDSIAKVGTTYIRYLPQKLRVQFDATTGYHTATITRLGHTTLFGYSAGTSGLLTSVTVPPGNAKKYTFSYTAANKLDTISNPGPGPQGAGNSELRRRTRAFVSGNQLMSLRDCDNAPVCNGFESSLVINFAYAAGTNLIKSRSDRNGIGRSFFFDSLYKLTRDSLSLQSFGRTIVARIRNEDSVSRPSSLVANAVRLDSAYVRLDGPRALPIADYSYFWLDRLGAPSRMRTALGDTTVATADAVWPGLVARIRNPSGQVLKVWYNSRALVDSTTDSTRSRIVAGLPKLATTRIVWDPGYEAPITITLPEGEETHFTNDATTGNRLTQYAGPDASRFVQFSYNASGLLSAIKTPLVTRPQRLVYDPVLQNIDSVLTPRGYPTIYSFDSLGRLTGTKSPIDSSKSLVHGLWLGQTILYDALDRDTMSITSSPAVADTMSYAGHRIVSTPTQTLTVTKQYDGNGNVLQHSTKASDVSHAQIRQWRFDLANRPYQIVSTTGYTEGLGYDESGNIIADTTRRGDIITSTYDVLNRLTMRIIPAVNPPGFTAEGRTFPQYGSAALAVDTEVFAFDSGGSMVVANNSIAHITRQFNADGSVSLDSVAMLSFDRSRWDLHAYALRSQYDLDGRRSWLRIPRKLAPQTVAGQVQDTMTYGHDPVFGKLATVNDVLGGTFTYVFDKEGRVIETDPSNSATTSITYDNAGDGQLKALYASSFPSCYSNGYVIDPGWLLDEDVHYDGRGKAIELSQGNPTQGQTLPRLRTSFRYSALGALEIADNDSVELTGTYCNGPPIEDHRYANPYSLWTNDALGNITYNHTLQAASYGTAGSTTTNTYDPATLQLTRAASTTGGPWLDVFTDTAMYNQIGDRTYLHRFSLYNLVNHWEASYYSADGKLYALDRQSDEDNDWWVAGARFQYQYDALGRRVQTTERMDPLCGTAACRPTVQRTIWDGSQLLFEIRYPADSANHWDLDTGLVANQSNVDHGHFGRVLYTHGSSLDQPVGIVRMDYGPGSFFGAPTRLTPSWNWRGLAVTGTFDNRLTFNCQGGTYIPVDTLCFQVGWAGDLGAYLRGQQVWAAGSTPAWEGSLIHATSENTDQIYMRNRYYDPVQGRFTQEDPIGLAGGLNAYGFAASDPVNFNDPFGLCPPIEDCLQDVANWGAQHGGSVGSVALNGAAALNAVNDFNPISGAFDAGFDIGSGHASGLAEAALVLAPLGGEGRLVIGKLAALESEEAIGAGERTLMSELEGDLGSYKANWARNAGALRAEMAKGLPIRDASVNAVTGALEDNTGFLRAERNLLQSKGWTYDASERLWNPPK